MKSNDSNLCCRLHDDIELYEFMCILYRMKNENKQKKSAMLTK